MDTAGVSAHEVDSILGLTMLSRDKGNEPSCTTPEVSVSGQQHLVTPTMVVPPVLGTHHMDEDFPVEPDDSVNIGDDHYHHHRPATRWRPPGASCEVLYHDKWHRGTVDAYTTSEAIIRLDDDHRTTCSVDLLSEKHRLCWNIGAMTSRTTFA